MEQEKYQVLRIWKTTHSLLRRIAASTDESLVETIDRLAKREWRYIQQKEKGENTDDALHKD